MSVYFGWYLLETKATSEVVVLLDDSQLEIPPTKSPLSSLCLNPFVYYSTYSNYSGQ